MKESRIEKTIKINYWWKCNKFKNKPIPQPLEEALTESAEDRIFEMMKEGYSSGELTDNVNMYIEGHKTPEDGWECHGAWEIETLTEWENEK